MGSTSNLLSNWAIAPVAILVVIAGFMAGFGTIGITMSNAAIMESETVDSCSPFSRGQAPQE